MEGLEHNGFELVRANVIDPSKMEDPIQRG